MLGQRTRAALEQQQWLIDVNDVIQLAHKAYVIELWKMYANGVAVRISIREEDGQFAVYASVGHAGTGTNSIEYGTFSAIDAAVEQLTQICSQYDGVWEA